MPTILPVLQQLLHFCLPNPCLWCRFAVQQPSAQLCWYCQQALPRLQNQAELPLLALPAIAQGLRRPLFQALWSLSWYQSPWSGWLLAWKFQQHLAAGDALKQQLARAAADWPIKADAVCYVPISPNRLQERGFNQAAELATVLATTHQLPILHLFGAKNADRHQVGADAATRRRQLRHQFNLSNPQPLPERLLLVDDVITTGATLRQLCLLLRKAGVRHIEVCTLLVTPAPGVDPKLYSSPASSPLAELNALPRYKALTSKRPEPTK
jgi:ComF family protein